VNLVKRVMEDDGLSDADMVQSVDTAKLAQLFDADAVLYVTIERWESRYALLSTTTEVQLRYELREGATGQELWQHTEQVVYTPNANDGSLAGLIITAIAAAIERAAPNYMPLARMANSQAVTRPHQGIPAGPYAATYGKDRSDF
jgi:hypothetical protein